MASDRPPRPAAQQIADTLTADKIDAVFRKWLRRLPHPFAPARRQAEFALTQVLDRLQTGRGFFEEVIRENLDIGRPDQTRLIFARRVTRRTPGRFRTRILTEGVVPSLHVRHIAQFLGRDPDQYAGGHMTYDLRRLRLHGLIERVPHSHRYRISERGARMAILCARLCAWVPTCRVTAHVGHTPRPASHGATRCRAHQISAGGPTCCLTNLTQVLRIHPVKTSST